MKQFVSLKLDDNENHQEPKQEVMPDSDVPVVDRIIAAIKTVYDPEIPVDIFALGLIYSVRFHEDKKCGSDHDFDITWMFCSRTNTRSS